MLVGLYTPELPREKQLLSLDILSEVGLPVISFSHTRSNIRMSTSNEILDSLVAFRYGSLPTLDSRVLARLAVTVLVAPIVTLLVWFTFSWATSSLRGYPGPFLAGMFAHSQSATLCSACADHTVTIRIHKPLASLPCENRQV